MLGVDGHIALRRARRITLWVGAVSLWLILLLPPCREYADYDPGWPRWLYIGDLFRPGNLYYPRWDWIGMEFGLVIGVASLLIFLFGWEAEKYGRAQTFLDR